jgi:hypothetical protein
VTEVCNTSCENGASEGLSLRVANRGLHLATRVSMKVTRADGLDVTTLDFGEVPAATATASVPLQLTLADFAGGPLRVEVDSAAYDDCNPGDDVLLVPSPCE